MLRKIGQMPDYLDNLVLNSNTRVFISKQFYHILNHALK